MSSVLKESYKEANRILKEWNPTAYDRSENSAIQIEIPQLQNRIRKDIQNARDQKWSAINYSLHNNHETFKAPKCTNNIYFIIFSTI